jgi:predicted methyltransferase
MKRISIGTIAAIVLASLPLQTGAQPELEAILADESRPQAERDRDEGRKPDRVLRFFDIGPGDHVADLFAGSGYWTRILVPVVGADGKVYAGNNPFFAGFFGEQLDALLGGSAFTSVVRIDGRADALPLPTDGSLDAVLVILAYHDLWLTDEDRAAMNRTIFAALKPGGVYGIIDHDAAAEAGTTAIESLHRVEKRVVIDEVLAAGFILADEGNFLRNPEDDHTTVVFNSPIEGKTDRFVLRFEKPGPLFASEDVLDLTLTAPMRTLIAKRAEYPEADGVITVAGASGTIDLDVQVRTRGKSRLSICTFPPLRLDFKRGQVSDTVFAGQNRLKLATRCKIGDGYGRYLELEYQLYRVFALLSDIAYRVRPVRIRYVDTEHDNEVTEAPAFLIQAVDELAARSRMAVFELPQIPLADLDVERLATLAMFEYFIGNTDWSVTSKNANDETCCHNTDTLTPFGGGPIVSVPFDFDQAGIINTAYALPNEKLGIRSVRVRKYRGFCAANVHLDAVIAKFNRVRPAIEAIFTGARLDERSRESTLEYVAEFYETVNDPNQLQKKIIDECREGGG